MMDNATRRAIDSYQNEARFRALAQSIVARVTSEHGPVDPERADAEAHEIAVKVAVLMLQQIYDEDAELNALRVERDAYKNAALKYAEMAPLRPFVADPPK